MAAFAAQGFPTTRDEEWRFTPVTPIADTAFVPGELLHVSPDDLAPWTFGAETAAELVFVNGIFVPALSRVADLPGGLEVGALSLVLGAGGAASSRTSRKVAPFERLAVHGAEHGALRGRRVRPRAQERRDRAARPRAVLLHRVGRTERVASAAARASSVSTRRCASSRPTPGPRATCTSPTPSPSSSPAIAPIVDHYRVQRESTAAYHVGAMQVRTGRETVFVSHNLALGAALARNDIGAVLGGEGGDTTLNGLYVGDGTQLVDNHTTIDHAQPHNGSHEVYKGLLGGRARGVFNGKIIVRPDAQKTDAKQTNKALLLSRRGADQHQAAARDLRRRREVHARGDGGPARSRHAVLPARARARPG